MPAFLISLSSRLPAHHILLASCPGMTPLSQLLSTCGRLPENRLLYRHIGEWCYHTCGDGSDRGGACSGDVAWLRRASPARNRYSSLDIDVLPVTLHNPSHAPPAPACNCTEHTPFHPLQPLSSCEPSRTSRRSAASAWLQAASPLTTCTSLRVARDSPFVGWRGAIPSPRTRTARLVSHSCVPRCGCRTAPRMRNAPKPPAHTQHQHWLACIRLTHNHYHLSADAALT